ncbi:ribosomal protein L7/L12 [Amycolatopsis sp. NPDC049252]|uniref:ribosomal protein L7/L12 n=1 Tax=Amycolatopsis sp. NPDC049252 TaxID=3363933 RepID=UPI0037140009
MLFLGVLALAARKKEYDGEVLLIIEGPETAIIRAASLRKNAKELVTGTPSILLQQVPAERAEAARRELESAGATVELW